MPNINHCSFDNNITKFTETDIKYYMKDMFQALSILEDLSICHRDIKPENFLFNLETKKGILIDFGISICEQTKLINDKYQELYNLIHKLKSYNRSRTGTRGFIAPEIIFDINRNSTKSDIWSAGVLLFCLLYQQKSYYWESIEIENNHSIIPLIYLYDYDIIEKFLEENNIRISVPNHLKNVKRKFSSINNIEPNALDLLNQCLCLDYKKRINAKNALNHPWFLNIN